MPSWYVIERCQSMRNAFLSAEAMPVCHCLPFQWVSVGIIYAHAPTWVSISMPETTESFKGDKQEAGGHWCKLAVNMPSPLAPTSPFPVMSLSSVVEHFSTWVDSSYRLSLSFPTLDKASQLLSPAQVCSSSPQLISNLVSLSPNNTMFTPLDRQSS